MPGCSGLQLGIPLSLRLLPETESHKKPQHQVESNSHTLWKRQFKSGPRLFMAGWDSGNPPGIMIEHVG